jgi:hypothetical protein
MNTTNTANINTVQEKSDSEKEMTDKNQKRDDHMAFLKEQEEIRDNTYLTNKYKFDFPDDGMSQFDFMLLTLAIDNYEKLVPITRTKEYKSRHGLS